MFRYLLVSNGLAVAILWWLLADLSGPVRIIGGVLLLLAILTASVFARRRARRLRSRWEGHPPQVIRHDGGSGRRRQQKSEEDPEFFVGDRW